MSALFHSGVEQRRQRWRDWMSGRGSLRHLYMIRYQPDEPERPQPWPDNVAARIDYAWDKYRRQVARMEWLEDDNLPYLDVYTGTEIFAEAFGCAVHRPPGIMPAARPLIHEASEVAKLSVPTLDAPPLARLFGIADELVRRAGRGALVRLVDIQSPMDIAALIWDKNDFFPAMVDSPEAVHELAGKVRRLLISFLDEWFARYGHQYIAHYPDYYMEGGITLSEDEVGAVSGAMFNEFFGPELAALSEHFGGLAMHCCANSSHQWANFKALPGLRFLNIVQPQEVCRRAFTYFSPEIAHWHSWSGDGPAWTWPGQQPAHARAVIEAYAASRAEALEMAEKLAVATGRWV